MLSFIIYLSIFLFIFIYDGTFEWNGVCQTDANYITSTMQNCM